LSVAMGQPYASETSRLDRIFVIASSPSWI
jgi:hypothetical protein